MKRKSLLIIFSFALCTAFLNKEKSNINYHVQKTPGVNFSVNPPEGRTGAPGEPDCTQCHAGTTQSGFGIVDFTYSGTDQKYVEGQTYSMTIGSISGSKNGFEMVVLDENDENAGSFISGTNSNVITSNGREYIRQSSSLGISSWSFDWVAPSTDVGDLTVYYAYNKSNNDNSPSGDPIYLGQHVIYSSYVTGVSEYDYLNNRFKIFVDKNNNALKLDFYTNNPELVVLQIRNVSGQLLLQKDLGVKNNMNTSEVDISSVDQPGIYVVSLFIGNKVFNRKVYF